nr:hypothetical protein orf153 [Navicula sp.]WPV72570.1 hypothetical protein orf153 [Navicula sp.]WPV72659.1 hypothetical protein orf153 [Navicula sp.]WPV72728.1 hypothetical protein orf153 [Navicula sp.]
MSYIPGKPAHRRFALRDLNETQYKIHALQYSKAKAGGMRCVYLWASGAGVISVVRDFTKGVVINYGKRKIAALFIGVAAYTTGPSVVVFTNATKIVKIAKSVHGLAAFCFECVEDSSNLMFLPLDAALFGQPIPIGSSTRFNLFKNYTDFFDI